MRSRFVPLEFGCTTILLISTLVRNRVISASSFVHKAAFWTGVEQNIRTPFKHSRRFCVDSQEGPMRGVKKENLPQKTCVVCNRPFTWRKKWEKVWDEVTTCSKSCNRKRKAMQQSSNKIMKSDELSQCAQVFTPMSSQVIDDDGCVGIGVRVDVSFSSLSLSESYVFGEKENCWDADQNERTFNDIQKANRKAAKKAAKAKRRALREGKGDPTHGQKLCDICGNSVDLLIRCTIDSTSEWKMVCGKCWHNVSGGVVDGDKSHPHYRYGGLWKNRKKR